MTTEVAGGDGGFADRHHFTALTGCAGFADQPAKSLIDTAIPLPSHLGFARL
jgi:hypothetical protein